ncbi:hypothetical protein Pan216_47990 [Planctomycetes bacterium Pan216]|uniref:Uncharacterized protein n=1 Tax=Kolteria novifilia TaxID=2527975 RepID=A0A518BAC0_9BACT|nr:hypothetical protein Pan216_47990 [Planctomycetes bacterium Pan216]
MNDIDQRMYRYAMKLMVVLAIGSAVMLTLHYTVGILNARTTSLMAVGVVFWLIMFYGYRQDLNERDRLEREARQTREPQEADASTGDPSNE